MTDLWHPVLTSLEVSVIATMICMVVGIPLGFVIAVKRFWGKTVAN